jgi:hypothetical protein
VVVLKFASTGNINQYVKNVVVLKFVSTGNKNNVVKNVVVLKFVSTGNINKYVKNVVGRVCAKILGARLRLIQKQNTKDVACRVLSIILKINTSPP